MTLFDQVQQKPCGMGNLEFVGVVLPPHLVAGRAGEDHLFGPFFSNRFQVMFHKLLKHLPKACPQHGKAAAPFLFPQKGKVNVTSVKNFRQGYGDFLDQGKISGRASREIDDVGLIFDVVVIGRVPHILHPFGTLFVVLCKDIVVFRQVIPNHVDFFGVAFGMDHVLAKGKPQIFKMNADGTDFLAVPAKGAAKHRVAEVFHLFFGGRLFSKQMPEKTGALFQEFLETFHAVNRRKLSV